MKIRLTSDEIRDQLAGSVSFPTYSSPLINLANRFARGTVPKVVGQMSDLIQEWERSTPDHSLNSWREWYLTRKPHAIDDAAAKVKEKLGVFRERLVDITDEQIHSWVEDLVITKTFLGLRFQEAILMKISSMTGRPYRLADPEDEAKGIDGVIGKTQISIKPTTYQLEKSLSERIGASIVYYTKDDDGITFEVSDELLNEMTK